MRRLLAFSVCPALLFAACNRQSDPPSVTNGVIVIDTAQSLRHDLSLTPATRHHLASLGFSYGVQAERGRWTGDTNSLSFTEDRLRAVVDGLGRDDAAPWRRHAEFALVVMNGGGQMAIARTGSNEWAEIARVNPASASEGPQPRAVGREDASDIDRVSEDSNNTARSPEESPLTAPYVFTNAVPPERTIKHLALYTDSSLTKWISATLDTPGGREPAISDFIVESTYEPSVTHADGRWLIRFKVKDAAIGREDASDVERVSEEP